jgi:ABC-type multidrug transport system fused ATPase/permease subunit
MRDGKVDKNTQERLWKLFFGEIKVLPEDTEIRGRMYKKGDKIYSGQMVRFKNIREFIKSAQNYIKNIDNTETVKFYEAIEKCNDKYGNYGAQVCFDEGNILILEIKSFQANQALNSHTRHCIKDSLSQWDYYVGGEGKTSKQYYIYNFNLPSYDTKSVIGITIDPGQRIAACHLKDDAGFSGQFKELLKNWEKEYGVENLWSYFKPLTDKEIEEKRRRIVANREIVKKGLTIGILGVNGSGKSTLLQIICSVLSPTYGEIKVDGKIAALLELGAGFNPELTGYQNVLLNLAIQGLSKDATETKLPEIQEFADIGDFFYNTVIYLL